METTIFKKWDLYKGYIVPQASSNPGRIVDHILVAGRAYWDGIDNTQFGFLEVY